ncbi:MAG: nodulation protein NfeD [Desulfurococcales archaeon]|nr:nodulation protein NfeD [Desulfurococcales archaeon]
MSKWFILIFLVIILVSLTTYPVYSTETSNHVIIIEVTGSIDYGIVELVKEGIERAEAVNGILVMVLDTPGGLLDAAMDIVSAIRTSNVPVVGYVYPPGRGAWSAGTLILLATHVAAMAPGTIIGSLQPIQYNPATGEYELVNESKIINPVLELTSSLASDRGRNVTVAREFVLKNLNLEARKALKYGVIEYVASSLDELLEKINGHVVKLDNGREVTIITSGAIVEHYRGSIRANIIHFFSDPLINGLLATLGILILLFGLLSGHYIITPIGIALLILSLIGAGFSANLGSIALIMIGAIALGIELVTPGFGVLGFTGIVLIALGIALMPLFAPGWLISPEYQKAIFWTGVSFATVMGVITAFIVYKVIQARRKPPTLKLDLIGLVGKAIEEIGPNKEGFIKLMGEYWRARSDEEIKPGDHVLVVAKDGPILIVKKTEKPLTKKLS